MFFFTTRPEKIKRKKFLFSLLSWADACANRTEHLRPEEEYPINGIFWYIRTLKTNLRYFYQHSDLLDFDCFNRCDQLFTLIEKEIPQFLNHFDERNLTIHKTRYIDLIKNIRKYYPREYLHYRLKTEDRYLQVNYKIKNLHECEFY